MTFEELKLTRQFLNAIEEEGFQNPTPVQEQAIPKILSGQHLIGIAQTGTGKTAAYLLPVFMKIKYAQGDDPRVIVLVPTKELVLQVKKQGEALARYTNIRFTALYGGVGKQPQIQELEAGTDVIIATPRRLSELYNLGAFRMKKITTMILDEADRMLDMGFLPQINAIMDILPRKKQNLLFSATFPPKVEKLSQDFMDFPVKIEITPQATPVETVEQILYPVPNTPTKMNLLEFLLQDEETFHRVIIFCKTKKTTHALFTFLKKKATKSIREIHSNKGQNTRINAMNDFKSGEVRILVATDVAARGIDVESVSHVINFDVPVLYEDYVHRIGRTGRAFKTGTAITFMNDAEKFHIKKIEKLIGMFIPKKAIPEAVEIPETSFEEKQEIAKSIDHQRRKDDPNYKGAFHDKKRDNPKAYSNKKSSKKGRHKNRWKRK